MGLENSDVIYIIFIASSECISCLFHIDNPISIEQGLLRQLDKIANILTFIFISPLPWEGRKSSIAHLL